jgi:hypothetical protein
LRLACPAAVYSEFPPPMKLKSALCLPALLLAVATIRTNGQSSPCAVYFSVVENDQASAHHSILKMNQPQSGWYEKVRGQEKYAGICYVENGASVPVDQPLYAIVWGEHSSSDPYAYSYEATAPARGNANADIAGLKGNASVSGATSGSASASDSNSGPKHSVADGWLAVWTIQTSEGKGNFVPIGPLHSRNRNDVTSASTSMLEDALEQISKREKERLSAAAKGWAVVTIRPMYVTKPSPNENPTTIPQSSVDTSKPAAPSSSETTALKSSPGQSSAVTSAVRVNSTLPGADIFVDEDFVGNTPSTINVTTGKHVITVKKPGFQDWVRVVNFSGGLITLNAELETEPSEIVAADPPAKPEGSMRPAQKAAGWIGVSTKSDREGALVTDVIAKSPAARAGIHVGDVILALDGRRVKSEELQTVVASFKPGTRVPVSYASGSSTHEVWITVAPEAEEH